MVDWHDWLRRYDDPGSAHSRRLQTVRRLIERRIERTAPKRISVLSICAGDGRDILNVLAQRHDAERVCTTLVELDQRLCDLARDRIEENNLTQIEVRQADAGMTDAYVGLPPADLVILVGALGNMSDADARATIEMLPALCARNALVVWSLRRHGRRRRAERTSRNDGNRVDRIRRWFIVNDFEEAFVNRDSDPFYVGATRFFGAQLPLPPAQRFFTFETSQDEGSVKCDDVGATRSGIGRGLDERSIWDDDAGDPNEGARRAWESTVAAISFRLDDARSKRSNRLKHLLRDFAESLRVPRLVAQFLALRRAGQKRRDRN